MPRQRGARYEEPYAEEEAPRRADGRHSSRSQFVDLSADQWGGEPGYDDSPTLVEAAPRRSRRAAPPEDEPRARRNRRGGGDEDDAYFSQLRGDAR